MFKAQKQEAEDIIEAIEYLEYPTGNNLEVVKRAEID